MRISLIYGSKFKYMYVKRKQSAVDLFLTTSSL